jgi:hypothetical protein
MLKPQGWDEAETITGEYEQIKLGGHICIIKKAVTEKSKNGKNILLIYFDIADGINKGFYSRQHENDKKNNKKDIKWYGVYRQLIEGNGIPFFKGIIKSIEESNQGYKFDFNEEWLKNKYFGGIFGREEYVNNKGEYKFATKCMYIRSVQAIKEGVEIPKDRLIENKINNITKNNINNLIEDFDEDDLPF